MSSRLRAASIPDRVVWRFRETAATLMPTREFRSWDLPALGRPTRAMSRRFRCCCVYGGVDWVEKNRWWLNSRDGGDLNALFCIGRDVALVHLLIVLFVDMLRRFLRNAIILFAV